MRISYSPFCKTDIKIIHAQKELESKSPMAKIVLITNCPAFFPQTFQSHPERSVVNEADF